MAQFRKIYPEHLIARACALYKIGFSYEEIERKTTIPKKMLGQIAKERQWQRIPRKEVDVPEIVVEGVIAEETAENFKKLNGTEAGHRIVEEAKARTALVRIEKWKESAPQADVSEHNRLVDLRMKLERQFMESAMRNQALADSHLALAEKIQADSGNLSLDLDSLQTHANITKANKATVLGTDPVIAIDARTTDAGSERSIVFMPAALNPEAEPVAPPDPVSFDENADRVARVTEEEK